MVKMLWATATAARFLPHRAAIRWYWAVRYVFLVLVAARSASTSAALSFWFPLRVAPDFRFPALSLFPGASPAHEHKWPTTHKNP